MLRLIRIAAVLAAARPTHGNQDSPSPLSTSTSSRLAGLMRMGGKYTLQRPKEPSYKTPTVQPQRNPPTPTVRPIVPVQKTGPREKLVTRKSQGASPLPPSISPPGRPARAAGRKRDRRGGRVEALARSFITPVTKEEDEGNMDSAGASRPALGEAQESVTDSVFVADKNFRLCPSTDGRPYLLGFEKFLTGVTGRGGKELWHPCARPAITCVRTNHAAAWTKTVSDFVQGGGV